MLCQLSYRGESHANQYAPRCQKLTLRQIQKMPPPGIAPGLPAPQAGVLLLYYSGSGNGGSGYRSRFSTLRRLYATMYNNPPCASIGTRTRILSLEGINTTLVLWTHDKDWRNVYGLAANGRRRQQNAKVTTTSAGFEPTRAEPIRFRV